MIRLEVSRRFQLEQPSSPGGPIEYEMVRMTLFAQEWTDGEGPDIQQLIAQVNDLSIGELCQCGHTGKHHEGTGRCEIYTCHCPRLQLTSKLELESVRLEAVALRKELAKVAQQRDMALGKLDQRVDHLVQATQRGDRAVARLAKLKAEYDI